MGGRTFRLAAAGLHVTFDAVSCRRFLPAWVTGLVVLGGCGEPVPTGHALETLIASNSICPDEVRADDEALIWTQYALAANGAFAGGPTIMTMPHQGGQPIELGRVAQGCALLAIDASDVYLACAEPASGSGRLIAMSRAGGAVRTLAAGQTQPRSPTPADGRLYWLTPEGLRSVALAGGSVREHAAGYLDDFAVEGGELFWTTGRGDVATAAVWAAPATGGKPRRLAELDDDGLAVAGVIDDLVIVVAHTGGRHERGKTSFWRVGRRGGARQPLPVARAETIDVEAGRIYATLEYDAGLFRERSAIARLATDGAGTAEPIAVFASDQFLSSFAATSDRLYYVLVGGDPRCQLGRTSL